MKILTGGQFHNTSTPTSRTGSPASAVLRSTASFLEPMIDWHYVLANGLWIMGVAVSVAGFSYHEWLRHLDQRTRWQQVTRPSFLAAHHLALVLVAIGLSVRPAASSWQGGVCLLLALASLGALLVSVRSVRR